MFDVQRFKSVMSNWASGIAVVTTQSNQEWQGFTANSFASVSIDPMLISLSVTKTLYAGKLIEDSRIFAVNILTQEQEYFGKLFAGMIPDTPDRFAGLECSTDVNGCPILPGTLAWLSCRVHQIIDLGASKLVLGQALDGATSDQMPLLYYQRQWGHFTPNSETE